MGVRKMNKNWMYGDSLIEIPKWLAWFFKENLFLDEISKKSAEERENDK